MSIVQDKKAAKALRTEMKDADTNGDGMISFIEFLGYFQKMARYRADLARTQRLESYGRPRDLPPSTVFLLCLPLTFALPLPHVLYAGHMTVLMICVCIHCLQPP